MIKHTLSPISDVDSSNIEQLLSLGAPALFAYLHADFNEPEYRANFVSFALNHRDQFIFGIAPPNLIASSPKNQFVDFALSHPSEPHLYPFIVLYNPKDEIQHVFEEPFENPRIEAFVSKWDKPLVGKFDVKTYYDYTEVLSQTTSFPWISQLKLPPGRTAPPPYFRHHSPRSHSTSKPPCTYRHQISRKASDRHYRRNRIWVFRY
jgi:hypothetical protein